jgi:hypothetical protein
MLLTRHFGKVVIIVFELMTITKQQKTMKTFIKTSLLIITLFSFIIEPQKTYASQPLYDGPRPTGFVIVIDNIEQPSDELFTEILDWYCFKPDVEKRTSPTQRGCIKKKTFITYNNKFKKYGVTLDLRPAKLDKISGDGYNTLNLLKEYESSFEYFLEPNQLLRERVMTRKHSGISSKYKLYSFVIEGSHFKDKDKAFKIHASVVYDKALDTVDSHMIPPLKGMGKSVNTNSDAKNVASPIIDKIKSDLAQDSSEYDIIVSPSYLDNECYFTSYKSSFSCLNVLSLNYVVDLNETDEMFWKVTLVGKRPYKPNVDLPLICFSGIGCTPEDVKAHKTMVFKCHIFVTQEGEIADISQDFFTTWKTRSKAIKNKQFDGFNMFLGQKDKKYICPIINTKLIDFYSEHN